MTSIPSQGEYRGVKIDRFQSQERVDDVVRPAIDHVMRTTDIGDLFDYLATVRNPLEARRLAGARLLTQYEQAIEDRAPRPNIDQGKVRAWLAGLDSLEWISSGYYCSDLDAEHDGADPRPAEFQEELAAYLVEQAA